MTQYKSDKYEWICSDMNSNSLICKGILDGNTPFKLSNSQDDDL